MGAGSISDVQAGKKKKSMVDFNLTLANISTAEDIEYTLHIYDYDSFETIDEVVITEETRCRDSFTDQEGAEGHTYIYNIHCLNV